MEVFLKPSSSKCHSHTSGKFWLKATVTSKKISLMLNLLVAFYDVLSSKSPSKRSILYFRIERVCDKYYFESTQNVTTGCFAKKKTSIEFHLLFFFHEWFLFELAAARVKLTTLCQLLTRDVFSLNVLSDMSETGANTSGHPVVRRQGGESSDQTVPRRRRRGVF